MKMTRGNVDTLSFPSFWTSCQLLLWDYWNVAVLHPEFFITCIFSLSAFRASCSSTSSRFWCSVRCLWRRASSSDASHRVMAISFSRRTNLETTHKTKYPNHQKTSKRQAPSLFFSAWLPQYFQNLFSSLSFLAEGHIELLLLLFLTSPGGHFIHLLVQKRILLLQFCTPTCNIGQILLRESLDGWGSSESQGCPKSKFPSSKFSTTSVMNTWICPSQDPESGKWTHFVFVLSISEMAVLPSGVFPKRSRLRFSPQGGSKTCWPSPQTPSFVHFRAQLSFSVPAEPQRQRRGASIPVRTWPGPLQPASS